MALYIYAGTLFLSAFILFLVQPIIGKVILPKLGGTPQVWNTCMVFFQMALLAGYAYTHAASTRLNPRRQLIVHGFLLFIPLIVLFLLFKHPFNVDWWNAPPGSNPIPSTLMVLATIVGLPFFVVSTTAPLMQRWFVYTGHPASKDPYFLYGASNLGSLLGLLLYPIVIEHYLDLDQQAWVWAGCYVAFIAFVLYSAFTVWEPTGQLALAIGPSPNPAPAASTEVKAEPKPETSTAIAAGAPAAAKETAVKKGAPKPGVREGMQAPLDKDVEEISGWRRFRWICLAAVPSSLMLGVTTHITTDLSPIPLFWVIPLSLYLVSFILVFSKWPVVWVEKPHTYMLYIQPVAIVLMLFIDWRFHGVDWRVPVFFNVFGFFMTAMVCHGELARDRPSTKHLTEFYLMMSVGGMVGGMFNGLIAPITPIPYVWEFSLAIIAACLFRPTMKDSGWTDDLVAGMMEKGETPTPAAKPAKGGKPHPKPTPVLTKAPASANMARVMDIVLPVALCGLLLVLALLFATKVYDGSRAEKNPITRNLYGFLLLGVPLIIACFYYPRPLRFALAITAIIIFHGLLVGDKYMYGDRSYFGIIRVREISGANVNKPGTVYHSLMHGNIDHGMNFRKPGLEKEFTLAAYMNGELESKDWGKTDKDFSRLATTYYHRYGPVGVIMERWNWAETTGKDENRSNTYWHWDQNEWHADARMPAALIGLALADGQAGALLPGATEMCHAFSEPPIATVGLGTGTMASYARPYMACHFYEIDDHIKKLSLPNIPKAKDQTFLSWYWNDPTDIPKSKIYFSYLIDAVARGADVQVYMGDAFQRMRLPYYNINDPEERKKYKDHPDPEERKKYDNPPGGPDGFYRMMVVDAFSSDAIPVHLLTKEAMTMYFDKLTPDGILCVHTSNRYVDLPKVVVAVAKSLGFEARRGHDISPFKGTEDDRTEHYTSEWVMVARSAKDLQPYLREPRTAVKTIDPATKAVTVKSQTYGEAYAKRNAAILARNPNVKVEREPYWDDPPFDERYIWTLHHSNLFNVLRPQRRGD